MTSKLIESEYDDFRIITYYNNDNNIVRGVPAYVYNKDDNQWYYGTVKEVIPDGDPVGMDGDYCGEFFIGFVSLAISVDINTEIQEPIGIEKQVKIYC